MKYTENAITIKVNETNKYEIVARLTKASTNSVLFEATINFVDAGIHEVSERVSGKLCYETAIQRMRALTSKIEEYNSSMNFIRSLKSN